MPAISYAGSATSRWDLMIGGTIKFQTGWADSKLGGTTTQSGAAGISRNDATGYDSKENAFGHQFWGAGESGFNFLVKGPDTFGAKTSAFMSVDFSGAWGNTNYGSANVVLAKMDFDWPNTSLSIGDAGTAYGMLPTFTVIPSFSSNGFGAKGSAPVHPQITLTQRFGKEWSAKFGIASPVNVYRSADNFPTGQITDSWRTNLPAFHGGITYSSGACGKVGPNQLTFGVSGLYNKVKYTYDDSAGHVFDSDQRQYLADFKVLVPIIPEKNGNKAGALFADGAYFYSQAASNWIAGWGGQAATNAYNRGTLSSPEWSYGHFNGYILHAAYYVTDPFHIEAFWWNSWTQVSQRVGNAGTSAKDGRQFILALIYDASPAVRFTFDYENSKTKYYKATANHKDYGTQNVYQLTAYYFF